MENPSSEGPALHSLTWTCQFPYDADTCYLAHCYPYTYSRLQRYLSRLTSDPGTAAYCKLRVLCHSLGGNPVHVLTITSPERCRGPEGTRAKRAVVVTARVHPGETNGSWMMEGLLDFLLGDSDDARLLRDTFVFKVMEEGVETPLFPVGRRVPFSPSLTRVCCRLLPATAGGAHA